MIDRNVLADDIKTGRVRVVGVSPEQATCDEARALIVAALAATPAVGGDAVAWEYELSNSCWPDGRYDDWKPHLSRNKPNVPVGSVRNLRPLYAAKPMTMKETKI